MQFLKKAMLIFLSLLITIAIVLYFYIYVNGPAIQSQSAILIDANSGEIVYKKNETSPFPSGDLSKLMTEYILLERIHNGTLKWEDEVIIKDNSFHIGANDIGTTVKSDITIRDLFHAVALTGNNRAALALAEHISTNEENFIKLMNEKARQLGLSKDTYFINVTGVSNKQEQFSKITALDASKLARQLLYDYPMILKSSSMTSYQFIFKDIHVFNTNRMLYSLDKNVKLKSVDGLQTSFSPTTGYSFVGTAKEKDRRLISVVLGAKGENSSFIESKKLFNYGFHPTYFPSFQSFKDYISSWLSSLSFKNFFVQSITVLFIIMISMIIHVRKQDSENL
ncbi:D-alanyl-D-alanine carboxypeptidase family protein [Bacillus cytotoxicus]|uniref:D-alanyl-D-alanine carboxypeptidase family protein n=1 Tax=Bacillus cytotoxicus TaxID=580165 RepID=UPI002448C90C|nr:D-alanyl-D-alanine carboxypeptidase [Bacillus cytotoxicus]MDH2888300.1 D-alanyl-D-alanine carboxypeptidase [Bacillus cytotoxicus]